MFDRNEDLLDLVGLDVLHTKPRASKESTSLARTSNVLPLKRKSTNGSRLLRNARAAGNASLVNGVYGISDISAVNEGQVGCVAIRPVKYFVILTQSTDPHHTLPGWRRVVRSGPGHRKQRYLVCWLQTFVICTTLTVSRLVKSGYQCENSLGGNTTEAYCKFGETYDPSSSFTPIADENFRISYADGETLTGILVYEKVTLANITVYNQTIGVVDTARWNGDGVSSGIIGLAYPALTSAFNGTNITADSRSSQVQYDPLFTSMYSQGDVDSLFTLTMKRGNGSSTLAIGGLPPAEPGFENLEFTSVPIEIMMLNPGQNPAFSKQNSYYTITPDGFAYKNATSSGNLTASYGSTGLETLSTKYPTIVDSGTSLIYLPQAQVLYINAAFDPPTTLDQETGYDVIPCNATAPEFGVIIGGTTFYINAKDMVLDIGLESGMCVSGVQNGGGAVNILGDVFLRNVIAVFDVGSAQMRFAPHVDY